MKPADKTIVIDNEYYQAHYLLNEESGRWLARVRVIRKDTNEYINKGFTVYKYRKNEVVQEVISKVTSTFRSEIEGLGVPLEWDSEVRKILVACSKHRKTILNFGAYCESLDRKGVKGDFGLEYAKFWRELIIKTSALTCRINKLPPQERLSLLVPPDSVYEDPSDSWSLEEIDNRRMVFDYFGNPTDEEKKVHTAQNEKLQKRFVELGWKN